MGIWVTVADRKEDMVNKGAWGIDNLNLNPDATGPGSLAGV